MIGTDSHTPNAGGLGMIAIGVGGADAVDVMAGLAWEVLYPKLIGVHLTGKLAGWTSPKDVILYLCGLLTVKGGTNKIIEYFGPGARVDQRHRQGHHLQHGRGARRDDLDLPLRRPDGGLPARHRPRRHRAAGRAAPPAPAWPTPRSMRDPRKFYDEVVEIDLSKLEPHIVGPAHARPGAARSRSSRPRSKKEGWPAQIRQALIGSCTNSSYEDMRRAADVAEQALKARAQGQDPVPRDARARSASTRRSSATA